MKALVTGGAGFIASHIVDKLIEKGHEVIVIDNLSTGKKDYVNSKVTFYERDISDNMDDIFQKELPEIVIHCAAQVMLRASIEHPLKDAKINILGTINLLETCKKNNVKKIIYTSTGGARVGEPKYLPVDEKHSLDPISPYGISKHTAEHYVLMYDKLYGIKSMIFCFGNVYGPRDDPKCNRVTSIFIDRMLKNESPTIYGDGDQTRDFIYVKDLADFVVNSIGKDTKSNLFHLANGTQISVNQIFNILKNIINFDKSPTYKEAIKGEVRDIYLDTTLASSELDWKVKTSFDEGLKETVNYFQSLR